MTADELSAFKKDFQEVLDKHEAYFEPVPMCTRASIEAPWTLGCNVVINKKVPVVEGTPSPYDTTEASA